MQFYLSTVFLSEIANPKQINCFLELEIESWSQDFFSKGFSVTHCLLLQGTIGGQSSIFTMQFIVFFFAVNLSSEPQKCWNSPILTCFIWSVNQTSSFSAHGPLLLNMN